ncbi:IS66 family insertion sequence element accessory protein TnpA [Parachitinimonas caeni]|uniref:Transposase n=1 Tax=Parachitinimonas caeni TaxID=3031301 RepID=A0ABT7E485_9NEIS|nr:hypothetical protein [Parachitinimonas caeni]MDK2127128.1 hypothetical protein [Parachitinimonas caeni]
MVQSCESWTEREAQVERWRSSGLKAEAYCAQQGLALPSFLYWVKRLRRQRVPVQPVAPLQLVPVSVQAPTPTPMALGSLTLRSPAGWQLSLPASWSATDVLALLRQLP